MLSRFDRLLKVKINQLKTFIFLVIIPVHANILVQKLSGFEENQNLNQLACDRNLLTAGPLVND